MDFNSGDNTYVLFDFTPKDSTGGPILLLIIDTPYDADLYSELMSFWKDDIKLKIQDAAGGDILESEFDVKDILHRDYKEGARIRIILRQLYDQAVLHKIVNLYKHDVKFEWTTIQEEIFNEE